MNPLAIIRVRGTQAEMGARHGAAVRALGGWEPLAAYYPTMPQRMLLGATRRGAADGAFLAVAQPVFAALLASLERARPEPYLARTRAFADALGAPRLARHLATMDVFQNSVGTLARLGVVPPARAAAALPPACSSLAVWGTASHDGRLLHARNFDFPGTGVWERVPAVVLCTPKEGLRYGFVTTRGADVPATAFNEAGLVLTAHTRFHRDVTFSGAAIADLCHDIVRRAATVDEAIAVARERTIASSWGLLVSSAEPRRAVVIETASSGVEVYEPGGEYTATTNHYQTPALRVDEVVPSAAFAYDSKGRYARLEHHARLGGRTVDDLKAMLGEQIGFDTGTARPTAGILGGPFTVASVVFDAEDGAVHVAVGDVPTARGPWIRVPWAWDGPPVEVHRAPEPSPEPAPAYAAYLHAVHLEQSAADPSEVHAALWRAADASPQPTYTFLAGVAALSEDDPGAVDLLVRAAADEPSPYGRGRDLLWASRAADRFGRGALADDLRAALSTIDAPLLAGHHAAARRERSRPYRRTRGVPVHPALCDAG